MGLQSNSNINNSLPKLLFLFQCTFPLIVKSTIRQSVWSVKLFPSTLELKNPTFKILQPEFTRTKRTRYDSPLKIMFNVKQPNSSQTHTPIRIGRIHAKGQNMAKLHQRVTLQATSNTRRPRRAVFLQTRNITDVR